MNTNKSAFFAALAFMATGVMLLLCACSRDGSYAAMRVEDNIPSKFRQDYLNAVKIYSLESNARQRLAMSESLHQESTWTVADKEWPVLAMLLPADEIQKIGDCRSVKPNMIAVPRILEGHLFFELIPLAEGSAPYRVLPRGGGVR